MPLLIWWSRFCSQVAALKPGGALFFGSVTGGSGVWSWSSVTVVGAGFPTLIPKRMPWAGERPSHVGYGACPINEGRVGPALAVKAGLCRSVGEKP